MIQTAVFYKKNLQRTASQYQNNEPFREYFRQRSSIHQLDEMSLVKGCCREDIVSQGIFYRHFYSRMMGVVYRYTNDADEATSILNNGFLRVFKKIHTYRMEGSLEGWIRKIIIHAVSDYFRTKHTVTEIPHDILPEAGALYFDENISYDYQRLLKLLTVLPPATRTVFNLFVIDGYTHKEIAKAMGVSEGTSKWHVAEGRKLLHNQLNPMRKTYEK